MSWLKKLAALGAMMTLMGVFSAPASADRFPVGMSGQPLISGMLEDVPNNTTSIYHCQPWVEFFKDWGLWPVADTTKYPGVMMVKRADDGTITVKSIGPAPCPVQRYLSWN
jgi:hypothetical protein